MTPLIATGRTGAVSMQMPEEDLPTAEDLTEFIPLGSAPIPPPVAQGRGFDWTALNFNTQEEFDSKPPELRQLIYEMLDLGKQYSAEQANIRLGEIQRDLAAMNSPQSQKAIADIKAQEIEARSKANEAAAGRARITSALETINKLEPNLDNLVGPLAPAAQMKDKWINPDIYAQRFDLANTTKNDVLEAAKYVKPLSNDERKFLEDMFPKIDDPAPVWRNYFERTRRMLGAGLGDSAPAPQAAPQGMAQPAAPPPLPQFQSREQVMQAVNAGQITREQGVQALRAQFGNQFR